MKDRPGPADYHAADCHAYVDDSLSAQRRGEFEAALGADPQLRRRVEAWQAQNEAIRLAFGAPLRPRAAPALGRPSNENVSRAPPNGVQEAALPPGVEVPAPRARRRPDRAAAVALLAAFFLGAGAANGPSDPRDALMDAGRGALHAFAAPASAPLDLASGDPKAVKAWLAPQFAAAPLGDLPAAIPGWRLAGARIVPGVASAAALVVYESPRRARAGLLIEALDAPPTLSLRTRQSGGAAVAAQTLAGYGIAAMGPDTDTVRALMAPWRRPD